jgi:hypothetical protein
LLLMLSTVVMQAKGFQEKWRALLPRIEGRY